MWSEQFDQLINELKVKVRVLLHFLGISNPGLIGNQTLIKYFLGVFLWTFINLLVFLTCFGVNYEANCYRPMSYSLTY